MRLSLGIATIVTSAGLTAVTALWFRLRLPGSLVDRLFAGAGLGLGLGSLMVQRDVHSAEWVVAPLVLGALLPLHARLIFAGEGPLRVKSDWDLARAYPVADLGERGVVQTVEGTESAPEPEQEPVPVPTHHALRVPSRHERREQNRKTRVMVRRVGPIAVLRVSLIFYFCLMLIVFFGLLILYGIMSAAGVINHLEDLVVGLGLSHAAAGKFVIDGNWLFARMFAIGCGMVVVASISNVLVAFLYNLISDAVGGLEVTLAEKR